MWAGHAFGMILGTLTCVYLCLREWRSEADVRCLSQSLLHISLLGQGLCSHGYAGTHCLYARLALNSERSACLCLLVLGCRYVALCLLLYGFWRSELRPSCLLGKHSTHLASPQSLLQFYSEWLWYNRNKFHLASLTINFKVPPRPLGCFLVTEAGAVK